MILDFEWNVKELIILHRLKNIKIIFLVVKVPIIFHNLTCYDSHLIIQEIGKFDVKISVVTNGLEKCMTFTIDKSLISERMQFMNSGLDVLVKNFADNDFKYLSQECNGNK